LALGDETSQNLAL